MSYEEMRVVALNNAMKMHVAGESIDAVVARAEVFMRYLLGTYTAK